MDASQAGNKTQFSEKMEVEYKTLFACVGAKYKKEGGHSVSVETKTTSTVVEAKGGSQDIASILSECLRANIQDRVQGMATIHSPIPQGF